MKPKPEKTRPLYQIVPYRRSSIRETVIWLFFCLILVAGAFGWGVIYEHERRRNLEKDVLLQDQKIKMMSGRLIALEGRRPVEASGPEGKRNEVRNVWRGDHR